MLRKVSTLSGRSDFDRLYSEGRRCRFGGLTVISAPALRDPGRVAFVASRRVGGAVARNRAKRRMRAAHHLVGGISQNDIIFSASPSVLTASFGTLVRWMMDATRD